MSLLPFLIAAILVALVLLACLFIVAGDRESRDSLIRSLRDENARLAGELTKARAPAQWRR